MKIGMVLILFILLVIATRTFASSYNDFSTAGDTVGFDIRNDSPSYTFFLASLDGDAGYPTPFPYMARNGGKNHFELTIKVLTETRADVTYTAYDFPNISVSFTLLNDAVSWSYRNPKIVNILTSGPIRASSSSSQLIISNA